ncbi:hypothetical protein L1987_08752 [Smallanthus sonchifolius]|uniref:Uncharacterized protein n=1 Tax=Smallanthus sonchifolius TaxID=185202 RepID=A0ACB9JNG7_9ASTR|nr:hypothetical protein L1987_08752 [Smallanthus sonchifolius]
MVREEKVGQEKLAFYSFEDFDGMPDGLAHLIHKITYEIEFYGDFDGNFHKSLELDLDLSVALLGHHSTSLWVCFVRQIFNIFIHDNTKKKLFVLGSFETVRCDPSIWYVRDKVQPCVKAFAVHNQASFPDQVLQMFTGSKVDYGTVKLVLFDIDSNQIVSSGPLSILKHTKSSILQLWMMAYGV